MSSLRTGYGLPSRPSEGIRTRRPSEPGQQGGIPRATHRMGAGKPDTETGMKPPAQSSTQSRLPSRVPQPSMVPRQAGRPSAARRPSLDHQATSWGSTSTTASSRSQSHTQSGSGSSSSSRSYDNNVRIGRGVLRRKKSSISEDVQASRSNPPTSGPSPSIPRSKGPAESSLAVDRYLNESPAEAYSMGRSEEQRGLIQSPVIYPELDRYRNLPQSTPSSDEPAFEIPYKLSTHDLPPPTPASLLFSGSSSQLSASPSTKFSGSPGPGPYSRDSTPTSMVSQSPGMTATAKFNPPKGRQLSPALTRPPVTRRRAGSIPNEVDAISADPHGLAAVRESLTSSSSSSTVKDGDRNLKERKPARRLPPPPPSPPPRKSSQKLPKSSDGSKKSPASAGSKSRLGSAGASPQKSSALSPPVYRSASPSKIAAPRRPSRDGAPDMQSQFLNPAPIVHSNLSSTSLPSERRGSESNDLAPSHQRSKNASTSQLPVGKDLAGASKPPSVKGLGVSDSARPSRTPSPNVASSFRFPFFGRRKTASESPPKAKKETREKKLRKGPVAGTGHEGYGRIGAVRRRSGSSNLSKGFVDNQTSQESLVSNDSFFADRMNPVVIAGGEVVHNRNPSSELNRTESNQSLALSRPSTESKAAEPMALSSGSRTTMWPSPVPANSHTTSSSRCPSDSSDSDGHGMKSTLAFRRSIHRLRTSPENPIRLPQPINTGGVASSPMTSFDTSVMSDESHLEMQREISRGRDPAHPAPKKLTKRDRSPRKWNLFGRSGRSQKQPAPKRDDKTSTPVHPPVQPMDNKPVAFYTMMDASEQDLTHEVDIQDILRSAEVYNGLSYHGTPETHSTASGFQTPEIHQPILRASTPTSGKIYQEAPLNVQPSEPKPHVHPAPANAALKSGRPSRLQQVGRIPKVISSRQEEPSPKSFSRPFRASMQSPPQLAEYLDPQSIAKGPSPTNDAGSTPDLTAEGSTGGSANASLDSKTMTSAGTPSEQEQKEFLRFSPRKDSDGTLGTSSSSGLFPFCGATAVIPGSEDPPVEDEVWGEYDDLLEDGHMKAPPSATSSKGTPFHLETYESKLAKEKPMESPTLATDRVISTHSLAPTASSCYSADMTERIRNAFQPHPSPRSPPAEEDVAKVQDKSGEERDMNPTTTATVSRRSLSPIKERNSDSSYSSSDDGSPLSQVNLRVGSMTVSKWLTFGHVLFSDVRHELIAEEGSLNRHSILVIDGLGNDDWSFYAAETYPAATFYNLSPRAPLPTDAPSSPSSFPLTPPNHHQIQFVSHMQRFPFAAQSFTSVVYRFPVAAPTAHYRNILSEARRVLKPGGYLELSILDVDLNNMGNRGRRAVRQLKERIHMANPDTNLASTADLLVRLVGKAGFCDVKAARVGVPVASPIARSHKSIQAQDRKASAKKLQPSLSEMMSDDSAKGDASITKMVARVGRWWYTRCYESATGPGTPTTVWNNKALLRECEELGTSLKLMVCCGRAPDRVSSV